MECSFLLGVFILESNIDFESSEYVFKISDVVLVFLFIFGLSKLRKYVLFFVVVCIIVVLVYFIVIIKFLFEVKIGVILY